MHQPIDLPEGEVVTDTKEMQRMNLKVRRLLEVPGIPGSGFEGIKSTGWEKVHGGGKELVIDGKVIRQGGGVRFFATGSEITLLNLLVTRPDLARKLSLKLAA